MKRGVKIELCGATAKVHNWGNEDLLPGVDVNTDAMARTTQLVQEGFVKSPSDLLLFHQERDDTFGATEQCRGLARLRDEDL